MPLLCIARPAALVRRCCDLERRARAGTLDLAEPARAEAAAGLAGLRVAKQAELDAVLRQAAELGERVRTARGPGRQRPTRACSTHGLFGGAPHLCAGRP
jgi:hypothetical protein